MKSILKNYASSLLLLASVVIGGILGLIFGEQMQVVKPIGDIFLNLMMVIIVPLIFFSIASAIVSNNDQGQIGKILGSSFFIFILTALIAAILGYIAVRIYNPFAQVDVETFMRLQTETDTSSQLTIDQMIVGLLTVSDFSQLLTKGNLLPLIIFSLIFGLATAKAGTKAKAMADFLQAGSEVVMAFVQFIMKFAPIGLGCYFAYTIGTLGPQIIGGYAQSLVLYIIVTLIYFFGFNTIYAFVAGGVDAVKAFWKHITTPALLAIATASSAACIPINIIAAKEMNIPDDIAETALPLGANTHKEGSVIGGVIKLVFMFTLFSRDMTGLSSAFAIIGGALLVGIVIGSIPSGGITGEIVICTLFGFPIEMIAAMMIISTIIDIPATLLNSTGNITCSMLISRLVYGKNWIKNKTKNNVLH